MTIHTVLFLCALGGYLLGSVPFGLVLTRMAGYGDIRKIGSGNIGATNVLRTGNKTLALLTVILDAFKAGFAAWLAYRFVPAADYVFSACLPSLTSSHRCLPALSAFSATIFRSGSVSKAAKALPRHSVSSSLPTGTSACLHWGSGW